MDDSILTSIKAALGLPADYTPYDVELVFHINSVLSNLHQLGVGPEPGFAITDASDTWSDLLETDIKLNNVKSYIFMKVKLVFDSASMSQHLISAYTKMIDEETWRIQVAADPMIPQLVPVLDPDTVDTDDEFIIDGGTP